MPVQINGATSGSTTINATDAVTATLTLPSTTGTLLSTANPQSGGVIQVVSATQTYVTTTSASLVDTGLTATITPKFNTSKVLVLVNLVGITAAAASWSFVLTDGSNTTIQNLINYNSAVTINGYSYSLLLSPATSSAITYKVRYSIGGGNTLRLADYAANLHPATITLLEIAA